MKSCIPSVFECFFLIINYLKHFFLFVPFFIYFKLIDLFTIFITLIILGIILKISIYFFLNFFINSNLPSKKIDDFTKPGNFIFGAVDLATNKIVAFNTIEYKGRNSGWMKYHFVNPKYFNKGIGIKLIEEIWKYGIQNNLVDLQNNKKTFPNYINIYGGSSSLQIGFWKKYATSVSIISIKILVIKISENIVKYFPIKPYRIYFNYYKFHDKLAAR